MENQTQENQGLEVATPATAAKGGRPATVSEAEIIAVGEQLERENKRVTGYLIRAALGTGRTDRYNEVWARHVASRAQSAGVGIEEAPVVALPAEIREAIDGVQSAIGASLESLAMSVQRHAAAASAQAIADADRRAADAEQALRDAEAAGEAVMDKLEGQVNELAAALEAAEQATVQAGHARQLAEGVAQERETKLAAAEQRERDLRDEITRMSSTIGELTAQVASLKERLKEAEAKEKTANSMLMTAQGDIIGLRTDLQISESQRESLKRETAALAGTISATQKLADDRQRNLEELKADVAKARSAGEDLAKKNAELEGRIAELLAAQTDKATK